MSGAGLQIKDIHWMRLALELALRARDQGEVPVGAIIVKDGEIIGRGWNSNITLSDPSAHAEIVAMREAGRHIGNHRLVGCTLYVTLEPCCMCAGAVVHARLERLVYGADDPKTGAAGGCFDILADGRHNHEVKVDGGCLQKECSEQIRDFFRAKRKA